jgi:hypothetical protein
MLFDSCCRSGLGGLLVVSIMREEEQVVAVWRGKVVQRGEVVWRVVWRDGVEWWGAKNMQLSIKNPNRKCVPDSARLRRNPADLSEMAPAYSLKSLTSFRQLMMRRAY